jgi:hypothetical protein
MIYPSPNISKRDWAMKKKTCSKSMIQKKERDSPCLKYLKKGSGENHAKRSFII